MNLTSLLVFILPVFTFAFQGCTDPAQCAQGLLQHHMEVSNKPDAVFMKRLVEYGARLTKDQWAEFTANPGNLRGFFSGMNPRLVHTLYQEYISELPTVTPFNKVDPHAETVLMSFFIEGMVPSSLEVSQAIEKGSPLVLETIYMKGTQVAQSHLYKALNSRVFWAIRVMLSYGLNPSTKVTLAYPHKVVTPTTSLLTAVVQHAGTMVSMNELEMTARQIIHHRDFNWKDFEEASESLMGDKDRPQNIHERAIVEMLLRAAQSN